VDISYLVKDRKKWSFFLNTLIRLQVSKIGGVEVIDLKFC
jgi:hypothetical protein